jgi:lipopolysaccharide/colanic/teichoic acid biosynthesis glycosyltransferase
MIKRIFDIVVSFSALVILSPILIVLAIAVAIGSPGGALFRQVRVGKGGKNFQLLKFRSMRPGSELKGQITVGDRDPRITNAGHFLRRTKLDELPQLINILKGDMSFVGPRPEVPKYVAMYSAQQRRVLEVRPGLTSLASIEYINENEILGRSSDPENTYVKEVMPAKLALDLKYVQERSYFLDMKIICRTLGSIMDRHQHLRSFRWVYYFLMVSMAILILDRNIAPTEVEYTINRVEQFVARSRGRGHNYATPYVVIKTEDGPVLQLQRSSSHISPGQKIHVTRSAILGSAMAYKLERVGERWNAMETEKTEYRPLPYLIFITASLLVLFKWRDENRLLIQAILGICLAASAFILLASGAYRVIVEFFP